MSGQIPTGPTDPDAVPPVPLAEATRGLVAAVPGSDLRPGPLVESTHHGHLVLVGGPPGQVSTIRLALGDAARPTFVRSAAKPFQATACLELLADHGDTIDIDPDDVPDDELAVAWASHRGERRHLDAVRRLLARSGTAPEQLTCPPALPEADLVWPPASPGEPPSRLRFNCSGKHALFALAGAALDLRGPSLLDPELPLQRRVLAVLDESIGPVLGHGVDGCGAPAVVTPLVGLARGFRSLAIDDRWDRVRTAGLAHPGLVGGEGRAETALLGAGVVAKVGAEAVYGAGWATGHDVYGLAVKVEDGGTRGAAVALVAALTELGAVPSDVWQPPLQTGGGQPVGVVRPSPALLAALHATTDRR